MKIFILCFLVIPSVSQGAGMPVVDTNQMISDLKDNAYMIDAVTEIMEEIGVSADEIKHLSLLEKQLRGMASDLKSLENYSQEVGELGQFRAMKGAVLADRIKNFSRYIKKLKRAVTTAASIGARPQAVLVSLQLLEQDRQRSHEKLEANLLLISEAEKLNEERTKIRREIAYREQTKYEKNLIFNSLGTKPESGPMEIGLSRKKKPKEGLF